MRTSGRSGWKRRVDGGWGRNLNVEREARGLQRFDNSSPSALQTLYPLPELSVLTGLCRFALDDADGFVAGGGKLREAHACSESLVLFLQLCHAVFQVSELCLAFITRVLGRNPVTVSPSISSLFGGEVWPGPFTWRFYDGRIIAGRCWAHSGKGR